MEPQSACKHTGENIRASHDSESLHAAEEFIQKTSVTTWSANLSSVWPVWGIKLVMRRWTTEMSGLVFTAYRDHKCGGKNVYCIEVISWKSRLKQLECLQPEGSLSRYASSLTDKDWVCVFRPYSLLTAGPKRQREFDLRCISHRHQYQWPERQQQKAPLREQV